MNGDDWDERLLDDTWAETTPDPDVALRAEVLARSAGVVRGRALRRRALAGAALVVMFVSGFAAGHVLSAGGSSESRSESPIEDAVQPAIALDDADGLEVRAEISEGAQRAHWYRLAGDAWLNVHGDTVSATRCYQRHLELAGTAGSSSEDSWLLLALRRTMDD